MSQRLPYFEFQLTSHQHYVFTCLQDFVRNPPVRICILKGQAGTGKTALMKGFIRWLDEQGLNYKLLATTGRAAKILALKSRHSAFTIHHELYVFKDLNEDLEKLSRSLENQKNLGGQIRLLFSLKQIQSDQPTVYIIDEASMISDQPDANSYARFGSGNLLLDILTFHPKAKLIFIGDHCQLPPVNQLFSPALQASYLRSNYNQHVCEYELHEVMRQANTSGIVAAATQIRRQYQNNVQERFGYIKLKGYSDIRLYNSSISLVNEYLSYIRTKSYNDCTLICQTNRHCTELNRLIRQNLFNHHSTLQPGDLLLITQNNPISGLMNGDQVEVRSVGKTIYHCNLTFRDIRAETIHDGQTHNLLIIEDILQSGLTNLTALQHRNLIIDFYRRMRQQGIKQKDPAFAEAMQHDPLLNAVRAVYGYAITCHKSQGGEWKDVFLYTDNKIQGIPRPGFYQWWYTAVTRASHCLHAVNDWYIH
ncbi:MAG: AAA family ATPase [Cyclobacteriaceae bacterium]|nr:AAA family ATPase [Cyclobacteriaceae bacterium]